MILEHRLKISKPYCQNEILRHDVFVNDYFIGTLTPSGSCVPSESKQFDFIVKDPEYNVLNQLIWSTVDYRWFVDNHEVKNDVYSFKINIDPNTQNIMGQVFGTITITSLSQNNDAWEGYATSTYFGDGEKEWPAGVPNSEHLDDINNPDANTFGAAIPWRYYCKQYGSRANLLVAYQKNWVNSGDELFCFDVQPITVTPNALIQGSYDEPGSTTGTIDINSDSITALQANGLPYPVYQVVPYEGCGGDCTTCPDCFNSCIGQEQEETLDILNCDFSKTTTECCSAMRVLYDHGNWENNSEVHEQFTQNSDSQPTAINYETGEWDKTSPRVNWCSGFSFHFDFAYPSAPWGNITPDPAHAPNCRTTGDYNNVMLRYRRRKCKNWK